MKYFLALAVIASLLLSFSVVSCDPYDPIEEDPDTIPNDTIPNDTVPTDTVPEIVGIYIATQADFDLYKNLKYLPGANIFFAAGKSFNGQFAPKGSGTASDPITVTAYNPDTKEIYWEDTDNKPIINGNGNFNSTFFLYNADNWIISNLEITNTDGSDSDQGDLRGIHA